MQINKELFDELSSKAKTNERLRLNYDLRTNENDSSQRMLNALEPGTIVPIHRHLTTAETVIVLRGSLKEFFYNDEGAITDEFLLQAGSDISGLQIPAGKWHSIEVLESGTVIFEGKDGAYTPLSEEDVLVK